MEILTNFVKQHIEDDTTRLILEQKRFPGIDIKLAVNCIESRRKLKGKVQEWYDEPRLIFPLKLSAEQCSSSATGRYKAKVAEHIISRCNQVTSGETIAWSLADLTGGLGVDSWFFSKKASAVRYNELIPELCEAAKHNFSILGAANIEVCNNRIEAGCNLKSILSQPPNGEKGFDIVYMDPARRSDNGRKVFLIEECTPDVLTLKDGIFRHTRNILIKLSPMADISMACNRLGSTCREVHVVASEGECKELLIWMDREWDGEPEIKACELHSNCPDATFSFTPSEEKQASYNAASNIRGYLFEPGKSLMKSGAYNLISTRSGIGKLANSTHYYVTDSEEKAEELKNYGKVFSIIECKPLDRRNIKEFGKKYPKSEVTARNIPMDTDSLRKRLGMLSGNGTHIFGLKSETYGNLLIATSRI